MHLWFKLILLFTLLFLQPLTAESKTYSDGHSGRLLLPSGEISFADEVVSFEKKYPYSPKNSTPQKALHAPDRKSLALSCGGSVVLAFTDNLLRDIEGADLHIFEIGPKVEPTRVAISHDAKVWREIGEVSGGKSEIDISPFVEPGEAFAFVKLTDLKSACTGSYPGADIDAVAAIGSTIKLSLSGAVLFDTSRHTLKPTAYRHIGRLLQKGEYRAMRVTVAGHTDSVGGIAYNQALSLRRANAVKRYLVAQEGFLAQNILIEGYGEARPIAENNSSEGRAKNRRVELLFQPR